MAKFDASTAVEALEWDFTAYGGGSGTIPEPSEDVIEAFFKGVSGLSGVLGSQPGPDMTEEEVRALADRGVEFGETMNGMKDLLATLCSDQPGREDLDKLPLRVLLAFTGWLVGEFRPEAPKSASQTQ